MSRYRNIHCLIWSGDKFPFLSDDCQLVFFHLRTTPYTTPIGIYKASIEALAAEKRWSLKRYRKALGGCSDKGFVKYDKVYHVICFPRYFKWNKPENPNVLKGWIKFFNEVPPSPLKAECIQSLREFTKAWGIHFEKVTERLQETYPKQEREREREREYKSETENPNPVGVRLSKLLLDLILRRNGDYKIPDLQKWALHIDKMINLDNRKVDDIENIIKWCQSDASKESKFWNNNILSTQKLRAQYDQLKMKMDNENPKRFDD